ncbi:hypothetical protein KFL_001660050 [Klebsormidium nitens]|uniref:Uncharacterized protein n=1 Tax=Klebsormidium nitens TaxID=105231 RepID=A0A1Y1I6Y3_KLENI|nr:hypothetical protein KFL_001660050 [Klebsormidium nitens]|eukprot:GAQ83868.1 hypothetical protein KFL_001660050 [Klebsormidium nitens]
MLRFYIHYEGSPEHTHLAKVPQNSDQTLASLRDEFVQAYNAKHGAEHLLDASNLNLRNEKRRLLDVSSPVVKAIRDRADLFIVRREGERDQSAAQLASRGSSSGQAVEEKPPPIPSVASTRLSSLNDPDAVHSKSGVNAHGTDDKQGSAGPDGPIRASLEGCQSKKSLNDSVEVSTAAEKASGGPSAGKAAVSSVDEIRAASERSLSEPLVRALLTKGLEAQEAQNYRQATKFFEDVLQFVPKQQICLRALASMALAASKFQRAKRWLTEALEIYPADAGFRTRLGDAFLGISDYESAVREYAIALEILERRPPAQKEPSITLRTSVPSSYPGSNYQMGIPYYLLNKRRERRENAGDLTVPHAGDLRGGVTENEVRCSMVRALYAAGAKEAAVNLVTKTLGGKEDNFGMLFEYSLIAADNHMHEDAMRALLKLLVVRQDHRGVRERLAALVRRPGGFEMLQKETGGANSEPAAQAFMAGVLKDYGLLREAATLYGRAATLAPRSVSYALNWLHALELCKEPVKALEVARKFIRQNGHLSFGRALSLSEVSECLQDLPLDSMDLKLHPGFTVFRNFDVEAHKMAPSVPSKAPLESTGTQETSESSNTGATEEGVTDALKANGSGAGETDIDVEEIVSPGVARVRLAAEKSDANGSSAQANGNSSQNGATPAHEAEPLAGSSAPAKIAYGSEQLDVLAVLFTVVKILYLGGAVERARQLAEKVEKARALSEKALHETMVRNEAAYFGCIYQVFTEYPLSRPLPPADSFPPLYLVGDSHCLTPAWRTVELRGAPRLLAPLLVTGLKCWHLRDESVFYPKIQFENVIASIPQNAHVIMMFGEIDCREGIVVSVDKGRYKDLEEGVTATVNIYVKVLRRLVRERGFEIFVHPPPAVLDETRNIVSLFSRVLKRKVLAASRAIEDGKSSSTQDRPSGALHWLDFFDDYLDSQGRLKERYKLDGTHMSPLYVELLDRELKKVPT